MCSWKDTLAIWPALAVGGGSFAVFQYVFATFHLWVPGVALWPLTDIGGGLFSLVALALFLKAGWKPRDEWRFPAAELAPAPPSGPGTAEKAAADPHVQEAKDEVALLLGTPGKGESTPLTARSIAKAWSPFLLMTVCLALAGVARQQESATKHPIDLGIPSYFEIAVPTLHREVQRAERLAKPGATDEDRKEDAKFKITWLTAPGTPVVAAAVLSMLVLRASPRTVRAVFRKTFVQMKVPIPTIACMLGLSYVTKYAGIDATLGVAFAETGVLYPFFAAILGWLGVFLTGTDAGSNALFGSLQKITAGEVFKTGAITDLTAGQAEVLICTANSTGGVMGKMIDAQSICVATAGTNQIGKEADLFKAVVGHSIFLACVVGAMTMLQCYVVPFTRMVPHP